MVDGQALSRGLGVLSPSAVAAAAAAAVAPTTVPKRPTTPRRATPVFGTCPDGTVAPSRTIRGVMGERARRRPSTAGAGTARNTPAACAGAVQGAVREAAQRPQTAGSRGGWRLSAHGAAAIDGGSPIGSDVAGCGAVADAAVSAEGAAESVASAGRRLAESTAKMQSWRPLKGSDEDPRTSAFGAIALEVGTFAVEADALLAGGGSDARQVALTVTSCHEAPPLEPRRTARAASLLLRLVHCLPSGGQLRCILEPLVQEVLRAVYFDWGGTCDESQAEKPMMPAAMERRATYYSAVTSSRRAAERADSIVSEARAQEKAALERAVAAEREIDARRQRLETAERQAEIDRKAKEEAVKNAEEWQSELEVLRHQVRIFTNDFNAMKDNESLLKDELRESHFARREALVQREDMAKQLCEVSQTNAHLKQANNEMSMELSRAQVALKELPILQRKVEQYEQVDRIPGSVFCVGLTTRIAREVLRIDFAELLPGQVDQEEGDSSASSTAQPVLTATQLKVVLERAIARLKAMPVEIEALRTHTKRLQAEVRKLRQLLPIWNASAAEDIQEALRCSMPAHEKIFVQKDQLVFKGLGFGQDLPPYLRTEGPVQHIFLSKSELESFIDGFFEGISALLQQPQQGTASSPGEEYSLQLMHEEVLKGIRRLNLSKEGELEFAYALICSIESYSDDPDFEIFSLVLNGAVHPSILDDQKALLESMQNLILACMEGCPRRATAMEAQMRSIRGVLEAMFPTKSAEKQNALRRSLQMTIEELQSTGELTCNTHVVQDWRTLFKETADGTQTPFVTEVRRQHCYEVIEYSKKLERALPPTLRLNAVEFREMLKALDGTISSDRLDSLVRLGGFRGDDDGVAGENSAAPEEWQEADMWESGMEVYDRLRMGTLLRPSRLWVQSTARMVRKKVAELFPVADSRRTEASALA
eukprot:TRINITY_DN23182_c0_g1_i1.p1 TRINITY_DN23182_c0_g1~~TRINITY_DN23182_c0_g1_i1.p1  ORF type:complete len:937 (+),score=241.56 TRINITY_DN23182_c0_g1_i1:113-2923(+)